MATNDRFALGADTPLRFFDPAGNPMPAATLELAQGDISLPPLPVNKNYDVPGFSGASEDGKTIYVDRNLSPMIFDGKVVDPVKYLAIRESTERRLVAEGLRADHAVQRGVAAERLALESDGVPPKVYADKLGVLLRGLGDKPLELLPADLAPGSRRYEDNRK